MRTVKLITWNPQDEVYEMSLGTLTATNISSYEISCTGDLHVGENLWVGDEFLTAAFIRSMKETKEDLNLNTLKAHKVEILDKGDEKGRLGVSDVYLTDLYGTTATLGYADIGNITCNKITFGDVSLDRNVLSSLLNDWNPSDGDTQEIKGEKIFQDYVVLNDAYIDQYELGTGFVGGDMTVDANIIPETTSSWLGDQEHPWGNVSTQGIRNTWVENGVDHIGAITVCATTLKPDPHANVSGLGTEEDPWEVAYIKTLHVTFSADFPQITCGELTCESLAAGRSGITITRSILPDGSNIRLGDYDRRFISVYTDSIDFGTGYLSTGGSGLLSMQGSLIPTVNALYDLGSSSYKWRKIYTDNLQCTSGITLMADNDTRQIVMDAISGGLKIGGFDAGFGIRLEPTTGTDKKPPITCGKLHGELVSPEYVPTADHPTFPGENEYTEPPLFKVEIGSIIMAIPCWATLRSIFGNPQPAGKIIDVVTPSNWETEQPFAHTNDYENDPERGAWYYATFKPGSDSNGTSTYVPLSTATQGNGGGAPNYAYLSSGKYKLLSCVSSYNSSYEDYVPNGYTGACVMLQRIK